MIKIIRYFLFLGVLLLFSSCGINSYIMFKDSNKKAEKEIPMEPTEAYRIAPEDKFSMMLFVENGARLVELGTGISDGSGGGQGLTQAGRVSYRVRENGEVELPIIGLVSLAGLTTVEAQEQLKELYSKEYIDPFIMVEITNRRVIVFPGSGGTAQVVSISNLNTTLMEVLAMAGGITERGKAKRIDIIRETTDGRKLYQVDLSTVDGLKYADMIVQANDYIYVEPTKQLTREALKELTPIVSLITTTIAFVTLILTLK